LPIRLTKIDELTRPDHTFIEEGDGCYYAGEYNARRGFSFSDFNRLIINLRKPMTRRHLPEWRYKEDAILTCGRIFREGLREEWLASATLVPMPSSHTRDDPEYDDRLPRILQEVGRGRQLDIRELVVMTRNVPQSHLAEERVSIEDLIASMGINEALAQPAPRTIGIFDDVLTTGRHFKAVQAVLRARFPDAPIVGIFVVRRVPESTMP
jgi:predicted amidophosphoribosyltransferase